jgi:UDP-2,3-diacylglucosamine pyrophosphatase LpxH
MLLVHGHQGDLLADVFWKLGRFLTRHIWRRIESFGLKDPTSAALNFAIKKKVEKKIIEWVKLNNRVLICGHTHRPACPSKDSPPYFNCGCCIYPDCITCLEIVNSEISLVRWDIKTNEDRIFYVDREVLAAPWKIEADRDR